MENKQNKVLILYASQTGNAIEAADRISCEAERRGCPVVTCSMADYEFKCLPQEDVIIFVVSTTGQGDAPDSMKAFWRLLLKPSLTNDWLEGVRYAVFGLGDKSYEKYNYVAKKLDSRLQSLGLQKLLK